jgi:hypothetical protein
LATCNKPVWINYPNQRQIALNYQKKWGISTVNSVKEDIPDYTVYPIPAMNQLTIAKNKKQPANYKILDLTSKVVNEGIIINKAHILDISSLSTGIYIVRIYEQGKFAYSCKAVKI